MYKAGEHMKKCLAAICLALTLLLTGCGGGSIYSNYRELERLLPVRTLGMDSAPTGIRLSVSYSSPDENEAAGTIAQDGRSITSTMDLLQAISGSGQLYYSHTQYVIFGEDLARAGLGDELDFLSRDGRMRMGLLLFIVREGNASELVADSGGGSRDITSTLESIYRESRDRGGETALTCRETIRRLSEAGSALVCTVSPADSAGESSASDTGKTACADGYAIIKDGSLIDFLDSDLCPAASLLMGHGGTAAPVIELEDIGTFSLEMDSADAKISPVWSKDGSLDRIDIRVELVASVSEAHTHILRITRPQILDALARQLETDYGNYIGRVLALSRQYDADFLDLIAHLRQSSASKADALPDNWLADLDFCVTVQADIKDAGEMGDIMNSRGWGK